MYQSIVDIVTGGMEIEDTQITPKVTIESSSTSKNDPLIVAFFMNGIVTWNVLDC